ncbi:hypothetical protein ACHHYP_10779 [Achlya hypogyna]|uniref:Transcriptional coactivator p15 (PC4) C-terminal domain-containing protein n=1 Tax=Achlya hypogyna TaxID=1202772 RepID=A0A1V9YKK1_ACHHY|nr:hypothetical protein ACHHYP_10779 [Achlya hypogyna]
MASKQLEKPVAKDAAVPAATEKRAREELQDDDDANAADQVKKAKTTVGEKLADGSVAFDLSAKKQVTVRSWKSAVLVDLREYYEAGGERKPGKKGISLPKDQFKKLMRLASDVNAALAEVQDDEPGAYSAEKLKDAEEGAVAFALSSKRRVTVRKFKSMLLVDIREFYESDGVQKPGSKGLSLTRDQWNKLQALHDDILAAVDTL